MFRKNIKKLIFIPGILLILGGLILIGIMFAQPLSQVIPSYCGLDELCRLHTEATYSRALYLSMDLSVFGILSLIIAIFINSTKFNW